jgi:antitoxin component of RelBE/YafQ-DinJ toxin-antitoxin module
MTPNLQQIEEPKTEVLSVKVSKSTKIEFEAEARQMGLDNSKYLLLFVDSRHQLIDLLQEGGIRIDLEDYVENQLKQIAEKRQVSLAEFVSMICKDYALMRTDILSGLDTSKKDNEVNPFQSLDLQRDTQVNASVNGSVNGRIPPNTQENTQRVNGLKRIDELIVPMLVTLKIPLLLNNMKSLVTYVINERRTFSNFTVDELHPLVFEGFTDSEILYLDELGRISNHNS